MRSDLETAIRTIGDAGIEYIELWGEVPHAYHDWVDKKRLKDTLSTYAFTTAVHAPFTDLNPATPFEPVKSAVAKTLKSYVKFAEHLGAVRVTLHPGSVHNGALVHQSMEDAVVLLRQLVKEADGTLQINVENQVSSRSPYHFPLGSNAEAISNLLSNVEGVHYTLDTGHAHVSGIDPLALFDRFSDSVTEVHFHDNGGNVDEHFVPGQGSAGLREFLGRVAATDAFVCLELNPFKYSPEEVIQTVDKLKRGTLL